MSKAKLSLLLAAPLIPGMAFALPAFDQWSVTGGVVDPCAGIPGTQTCQVLVGGDGFVQAQIFDSTDGKTYIKSIVTDTGVTGNAASLPFADENFIRINIQAQVSSAFPSSDPGFLGKNSIRDHQVTGLTDFDAATTIKTGWATGCVNASDPNCAVTGVTQLSQDISTPGGAVPQNFTTGFAFESKTVGNTVVGRTMDIDQFVSLAPGPAADTQVFAFRDRSGTFLTSSGTWGALGGGDTVASAFDGIGSQATVGWTAGQAQNVTAFYIGQHVTIDPATGGASRFAHLQVDGDGSANQNFGYSQAGEVFNNATHATMGGWDDWADGPEASVFGARPTAAW